MDRTSQECNSRGSRTPETKAMIADLMARMIRKGRRNIARMEARQISNDNDKDSISDEQMERIIVRIEKNNQPYEDELSRSKDSDKNKKELSEVKGQFGKYRHHQYEKRWGLRSDDEGLDEEWFISNPEVHPEGDENYLCDRCRHIDFRALFTMRGLPGNHGPGDTIIDLIGLDKVMQDKHCGFCALLRQKISQDGIVDNIPSDELQDHTFQLSVLDKGPEYALSLEVKFPDVIGELHPSFVLQNVAEDAQAEQPLRGRLVDREAIDPSLVAFWYRDCKRGHGSWKEANNEETESLSKTLRLLDTVNSCICEVNVPCEYICLSYVWGKPGQTQYTTSTRSTMETPGGLLDPSVELSKTIRDAMKVTKDIGLRYIWIDALCILQDDADDKKKIIYNMGTIYGNSALTLVSLGDGDPKSGLPGMSRPRGEKQIASKVQGMTLSVAFQDDRTECLSIQQSKWNSRAWTFQERFLSKRLLYFTESQLYFECPHTTIYEDTVPVLDADHEPPVQIDQINLSDSRTSLSSCVWSDPTQAIYTNKAFLIEGQRNTWVGEGQSNTGTGGELDLNNLQECQDNAPVYHFTHAPRRKAGGMKLADGETPWDMYRRAVEAYSKRQLSFQSDAANAFLGIAHLISPGVNTEFLFGVPDFELEESLLWYPGEPLKRRIKDGKPLFPSWTWVAWEGHIKYRNRGWYNAVHFPYVSAIKYMNQRTPQGVFEEIKDEELYHFNAERDGWVKKRNEERNLHVYEHEAYPGVQFHYPVYLPNQPIQQRISPDGTINFMACCVTARFCDMSTTKPIKALGYDNYFQLGLNDEYRSANERPQWRRIIYHQGYRAGFLALNMPFEDVDLERDYQLVTITNDSLPDIESPRVRWDLYWQLDPVTVKRLFKQKPGENDIAKYHPVGKRASEDAEPSKQKWSENGDAQWEQLRFGGIRTFGVCNVLLLKRESESGRSERIGVGKISAVALLSVERKMQMIKLV